LFPRGFRVIIIEHRPAACYYGRSPGVFISRSTDPRFAVPAFSQLRAARSSRCGVKQPAITLAATIRDATRHLNDDRLRLFEQLRAISGMEVTMRAVRAELGRRAG
jgi:hypothetical protein